MKTKKIINYCMLVLFTSLIFSFNSCKKKDTLNDTAESPSSNKSIYNLKVDGNGIINFRNVEEFSLTVNTISNLTEKAFTEWEKSLGFKSLETKLLEIYEDLDSLKTEEELLNCIKLNNKYIHLVDNETGEKTVTERNSLTIYNKICNPDAMYIIGDSIYKVGKTNIISANKNKKNELLSIDFNDIDNLELNPFFNKFEYIKAHSYMRDLPFSFKDSCKNTDNNRRCTIEIIIWAHKPMLYEHHIFMLTSAYGHKKRLGIWTRYKTQLSLSPVEYKVEYYDGDADELIQLSNTLPGFESNGDKFKIDKKYILGIANGSPKFKYSIERLYAKASSRGTGHRWAIIDHN